MHSSALVLAAHLFAALTHSKPINEPLLDAFDYIVVGGGASGLTVANRLSEDSNVTVLVLEAGEADHSQEDILVPIFVGGELVSQYNWGITTEPQTFLDGVRRWLPQGKALGGGTILNALLWNRGNAGDYDSWVSLGNPGWGWEDMLPYFIKSEKYTPFESEEVAKTYGITNTPEIHGITGPVSVTFQKYFFNVSLQWYEALKGLGVPVVEPNDGSSAGAMFLPMDLDATNMSRADARRSYYDPFASRDNLYVSTGIHVTNLTFDDPSCGYLGNGSNLRVAGVQYANTSDGNAMGQIKAKREVILAAGSLHTPQILEMSGVGMSSILSRFGIKQVIDLPGVGNNLQDHFQVGMWSYLYNDSYVYPTDFNTNATLMDLARQEYYANRTGPWTAGPPNGVAFPSLPQLSPNSEKIAGSAAAQSQGQYLETDIDSTVVAGYEAMKPLLVSALKDNDRSVIEILNNNAGGMTMSNMRPFSRGHSHIGSTDPLAAPLVDPRWGSNPADLDVLAEAAYFNRKVFASSAMQVFNPWQAAPPTTANDSAIRAYLAANGGTEYHPSGTCAMLPKELGGVVDPQLLVYGTSNLRIVDASIYPILPAAHLQAVVYGVAEKAADVIKSAGTPPITHIDINRCVPASNHSTVATTTSETSSQTLSAATNRLPAISLSDSSHVSFTKHNLISRRPDSTSTSSSRASLATQDVSRSEDSAHASVQYQNRMANVSQPLPLPPMQPRHILFPGSYPDSRPFDHPWDPEPDWNPKAIDQQIQVNVYGPKPSTATQQPSP